MKDWHQSQRGYFAGALYDEMLLNENIIMLVGDLGYGMFDKIKEDFPTRFINCGASEQAMMGIAVGLAIKGKIPVVYSITPFLLRRPYETIRLYLSGEGVPVKLVGSGRDADYHNDGPSHDATDAKELLKTLPGIVTFWPEGKEAIPDVLKLMVKLDEPCFISLRR